MSQSWKAIRAVARYARNIVPPRAKEQPADLKPALGLVKLERLTEITQPGLRRVRHVAVMLGLDQRSHQLILDCRPHRDYAIGAHLPQQIVYRVKLVGDCPRLLVLSFVVIGEPFVQCPEQFSVMSCSRKPCQESPADLVMHPVLAIAAAHDEWQGDKRAEGGGELLVTWLVINQQPQQRRIKLPRHGGDTNQVCQQRAGLLRRRHELRS